MPFSWSSGFFFSANTVTHAALTHAEAIEGVSLLAAASRSSVGMACCVRWNVLRYPFGTPTTTIEQFIEECAKRSKKEVRRCLALDRYVTRCRARFNHYTLKCSKTAATKCNSTALYTIVKGQCVPRPGVEPQSPALPAALCKAGTAKSRAGLGPCLPCRGRTYSPAPGASSCKTCGGWKTVNKERTRCVRSILPKSRTFTHLPSLPTSTRCPAVSVGKGRGCTFDSQCCGYKCATGSAIACAGKPSVCGCQ